MKPQTSYIAADLKIKNRTTVYNLIAAKGTASRTDIAKETGISAPTVMKIMNYLEEKDIIVPISHEPTAEATIGRKPRLYKFNGNLSYAVGIILEGEYLRIGVVNIAGEIISRDIIRCGMQLDENICSFLEANIKAVLARSYIGADKVIGIGIGVPGIYDSGSNDILVAPLIGVNERVNIGWLTSYLENAFGVPVELGNDVNMDVLGEYHSLGLADDDLLYISLGTGVGAGIILDGKLRSGRAYNAGEIGYMAFLDDYIAGKDNPGWLESRINLHGLKNRFDFDIQNITNNLNDVIEYVSISVALCINNTAAVLDLKNVSLGGVLTEKLGTTFIESVRDKLKKLSIFEININTTIAGDAGIIGAAMSIINKRMDNILHEE